VVSVGLAPAASPPPNRGDPSAPPRPPPPCSRPPPLPRPDASSFLPGPTSSGLDLVKHGVFWAGTRGGAKSSPPCRSHACSRCSCEGAGRGPRESRRRGCAKNLACSKARPRGTRRATRRPEEIRGRAGCWCPPRSGRGSLSF